MKKFFIACILSLFCGSATLAQEACSNHWQFNQISYQSDLKKKLAIIYSIDRENFEERKREFGSGLTMPVEGIPISGYANYNDFDAARQRMSSRFAYSLDLEHSESYLRQFVAPETLEAVKLCIANTFGLHAVLDRVQGESVLISLHWKPTAGGTNPIDPLSETVIAGELVGDFPTKLEPHNWAAVTYKRNRNVDFIFRAQGSGAITSPIIVPADPTVDARPYSWKFCNSKRPLCFEPDKDWNPNIVCEEGATVVGVAQNGTSLSYPFDGRTHVSVQPRHARVGDNHYSRVIVNGELLPGGYRLHTIAITCNP